MKELLADPLSSVSDDSKYMPVSAKKFAIGETDFRKQIVNNAKIIDKSLFIQAVIDDLSFVKLILRPSKFGKSFNLSMLKYYLDYFENQTIDAAELFSQLKIWQVGNRYRKVRGSYYVISLTFKDVKKRDINRNYQEIKNLINDLYQQFKSILLLDKALLSEEEKSYYLKILKDSDGQENYDNALLKLVTFLKKRNDRKVILLIDEYDTPITAAYENQRGHEMEDFIQGLLAPVLHDSKYLDKAIIVGILHYNISCLRSAKIFNLLHDATYSAYFGFTPDEVKELIKDISSLSEKFPEIEQQYGGILVENTIVFNPWSIVNCVEDNREKKKQNCTLTHYFLATGDQKKLRQVFIDNKNQITDALKQALEEIQKSGMSNQVINAHFDIMDISTQRKALFSYLLMTGYLRLESAPVSTGGKYKCSLSIPNEEMRSFLEEIISKKSDTQEPPATKKSLMLSLSTRNSFLNKSPANSNQQVSMQDSEDKNGINTLGRTQLHQPTYNAKNKMD